LDIEFEELPSTDQLWLKQLEDVAKDALKKRLGLTKNYLAREMALSERHLLRQVKMLTGLTVSKYILEIKLQKARHLLECKTFQTIAEVSYDCGFKSPGYFAQVFEDHYGIKASEY
jgi:AraC-like DNA-binding protein